MLVLISGGAGSGKSAFAEDFITEQRESHLKSPLLYIATMKLWDEECVKRAERHQKIRSGKGFTTLECPTNLENSNIPQNSSVLLEDLSNLLANETFGGKNEDSTSFERVLNGIKKLWQQSKLTVIVTNELFSDGIIYPKETADFLGDLGKLNQEIAKLSTEVYEVVAGIPICIKREGGRI